jgi:hypothetical protein
MIYVFTSATVNYLPKVRILFNSIKRHHPEFCTCLVLSDSVPAWFKAKDYYVDSVIPIDELKRYINNAWIFQHSVIELCTGVKGVALNNLLKAEKCEAVLYIDPDIVVFSRLDDLLHSFEEASVLLTPHQTKPEESLEAVIDNEICSMQYGIFNLGFIGVKNDERGQLFADWWQKRLEHFCFADQTHGVFTDQKWVDFAPVFFDGVKILKSSRFNVSTWNITTRKVTGSLGGNLLVDGQPLGFYHFSGFDVGACKYMANKYAGDHRTVISLVEWYEESLKKDKMGEGIPWAYGKFENGEPITDIHRNIYKMRKDLQEAFPDPFRTAELSRSFYYWFETYARKEHPELFILPKKEGNRLGHYLRLGLTSGRQRKDIVKRTWSTFKKEGFPGLKRALKS